MKLIYLDEAGNTGAKADPDQPIHMIGSLIVDQGQIRDIEQQLEGIAEQALLKMQGGPIRPLAEGLEFHGADLFNGKKMFENVGPEIRIWTLRN